MGTFFLCVSILYFKYIATAKTILLGRFYGNNSSAQPSFTGASEILISSSSSPITNQVIV